MTGPGVSCILPVFDEADCIVTVVEELLAMLGAQARPFEVIAVDDGSTDGSGDMLQALARREPRLRVVRFPTNVGYGAALRAGFEAATQPLVFFMDSDGQFDPDDLRAVLERSSQADVVVGYRAPRSDGPLRAVLSQGYNLAVQALFPVRVQDVNCAFKLLHRRVVEALPLEATGYTFNAELLARAAHRGFSIVEVPVRHRVRRTGRSKVRPWDVPRSFAALLWLRWRVRAPTS